MARSDFVVRHRRDSGQATVEYLFVVLAVLIAFAILGFVMQPALGENMAQTLIQAFGKATSEITYLINLPF